MKSAPVGIFPSLEVILNLPAFRHAELICGGKHLSRPVTWVHIAEILDVWRFLTGGELVLSTGLELARVSTCDRRDYISGLAEAGACALGLELVRMKEVPPEVLHIARALNFPVIIFRSEVSFRELTRSAHEEILRPLPKMDTESTVETVLNALTETGRDKAFIKRELGPVLALPSRSRATLLMTLEALLEARFNIAATSRSLGIRRQSIYYRLDQLTGLLGTLEEPSRYLGFAVALSLLHRNTKNS
jgi:purine catabolism regulator